MNQTENLTIYGEADARTVAQIERCLAAEEGARGVLCADNHLGYSQPIGGAVAYREHVSPSGVGYDIGCGNLAVKTNVLAENVDVAAVMDEVVRRVSFGVGRNNEEPVDHPVLDAIREAPFEPQRELYDLAARQLGTVGAGNHYVDLFEDEDGWVWVGVHFGSRGFGHKTASGFLSVAAGGEFDPGYRGQGEMDSPPLLLSSLSGAGQAYVEAMTLAGNYARAGRDVVVDLVVREILEAGEVDRVHNHHNYAWPEMHDGDGFWVVRKGCTPAWPGQRGFVGSTMGEPSVILEGTDAAEDALFSTVHGAGRALSRTQAAGKTRWRWECPSPTCGWRFEPGGDPPVDGACPRCGHLGVRKRPRREGGGLIDFDGVRAAIRAGGIELRGGDADEAPGAYKRLDQVLAAQGDTVRVLHTLRPIGVAMAGADVVDPFKD